MNIGEELIKAIEPQVIFSINVGGHKIPIITDTVITMWIVMAMIIITVLILTKRMEKVPRGIQNITESVVEFVNNFIEGNIHHYGRHFVSYLGTVLIFLIFSNIVSIFNIIPTGEQLYKLTHIEFFEHIPHYAIRPPTRDINVTVCLAIMSIIVTLYAGIKFKKFSGWLKGLTKPVAIMLPFNILDYLIRPLSLCFRLFGNILGAMIIMELLYMVMPAFIPAAMSIYFDLFDGILQAYVFVFLTSIYIAEAVE